MKKIDTENIVLRYAIYILGFLTLYFIPYSLTKENVFAQNQDKKIIKKIKLILIMYINTVIM